MVVLAITCVRAEFILCGTVREMRIMRATTVLLITALIAGCGSSGDDNKSGTETKPGVALSVERLDMDLDKAGENGFYCRIADSIVVSWFPGETSDDGAMWDSFYANYVEDEDKGLEILTTDGVSYARWTAGTEGIDDTGRRELIESLDGKWGTWGQPDTIALEELPSAPSGCLEWVSAVEYSDLSEVSPDRWTLKALLNNGETTSDADGYLNTDGDKIVEFVLKGSLMSAEDDVINVKYERPALQPVGKPEGAVELTQDEYMMLVAS